MPQYQAIEGNPLNLSLSYKLISSIFFKINQLKPLLTIVNKHYSEQALFQGRVKIDLVFPGQGEGPKLIEVQADPSLYIIPREVTISRLAETESSEEEDTTGEAGG